MELSGLGGGLMVAVAALLWLVYLVPNWFKRREYLATERNAVRLQQTIRVLAETAEIPDVVRAERALIAAAVAAPARLSPAAAVASPSAAFVPPATAASSAAAIRRGRLVATFALLAACVVFVVQAALMVSTGAVIGSWAILGVAAAVGVSAVAGLRRLAAVTRRSRAAAVRPARRTSLGTPRPVAQSAPTAWTPVAVPRPLYLSRSLAPGPDSTPSDAHDAAAEMADAAASAERALRARQAEATPLKPSRFASMGIVDDAAGAAPDLDAMLARRRVAG